MAQLIFDAANKPVNILTSELMNALEGELTKLQTRNDLEGLIVCSAKPKSFIVGADIGEIAAVTDPEEGYQLARKGQRIFHMLSQLPIPTVAAINGTCLGGGLELALACRYRVASDIDQLSLGLPEVRLGIIPGFGGTQRLPRLIGLSKALELILTGRTLNAIQAKRLGLVDEIADPEFLLELAKVMLQTKPKRRRPRQPLLLRFLEGQKFGRQIIGNKARERLLVTAGEHYPAPLLAIKVVLHGLNLPLEEAFDFEARMCGKLIITEVCKNLIHIYELTEGAKKLGKRQQDLSRSIRKAALFGAGTMGGDIAMLFARQGITVRLGDISAKPIGQALNRIATSLERSVRTRRLKKTVAAQQLERIHPTVIKHGKWGFANVDILLEAVVEEIAIKQSLLAELESLTKPECIFATNTSSLSVGAIADALQRPERLVGMHFFNPATKMPLVEIIAGKRSSSDAVWTAYQLALRLKKHPVIVKDRPGFLVNRLLTLYVTEAIALLREGYSIADVDAALVAFGMPLGPFELMDVIGIDICHKAEQNLINGLGSHRFEATELLRKMVEQKLLGKKVKKGFYLYERGKKRGVHAKVSRLLENREAAAEPKLQGAKWIWQRLILAMLNEAAYCLNERVVETPAQIDLAMVMGAGFPPFRGGLMQYAAALDKHRLQESFARLQQECGERFAMHPDLNHFLKQTRNHGKVWIATDFDAPLDPETFT